MKIFSALLLAGSLFLAACANMPGSLSTISNKPFSPAFINPGDLVLEFETEEGPQKATLEITTKNTQLATFIKMMVQRGYYNDQFFYDHIPGSVVLVGKARLSGRPTTAGPYIKDADKLSDASANQFGMVIHADGSVGPEFILFYGYQIRDLNLQPDNVAVGTITSGGPQLAKARKGDKLIRAYFAQ